MATSYVNPAGSRAVRAKLLADLDDYLLTFNSIIQYLQENQNIPNRQELEDAAYLMKTWISIAYDDIKGRRIQDFKPGSFSGFSPHI